MILRRFTKHVTDQNWFAVGLDVIVVVVGIFLGMQVTEWNESLDDAERLNRIVMALKADISDARMVEADFLNNINKGLDEFEQRLLNGEMPAPYTFQIKGSDTPPKLIWGAIQNAGVAELIDPYLLFELAHYYSERDGIGVKVTRYMSHIESEILPYIDGDSSYFYEDKKLKPQYDSSMKRIREWSSYLKAMAPWSVCLEKRLDNATETGVTCRKDWYETFSVNDKEANAID